MEQHQMDASNFEKEASHTASSSSINSFNTPLSAYNNPEMLQKSCVSNPDYDDSASKSSSLSSKQSDSNTFYKQGTDDSLAKNPNNIHLEAQPIDKEVLIMDHGSKNTSVSEPVQSVGSVPLPPAYSAFPTWRKRLILWLVTIAGFLGPLSGSIYLPVLSLIKQDFHISTTAANATVSVFMAVFAVAPLVWASWADFGGRKILYLISIIIYIASCICLAAIPAHVSVIFVFRIVQAFGAASVQSLGAGTVADTVEPKHRGKAISVFMLGPQLGPVLGPILGGAIASRGDNTWRWIFGFLAIVGFIIWLLIAFMLPETLRYLVGNGSVYDDNNKIFVVPHLRQKKLVFDDRKFPKPPKPSLVGYLRLMRYIPVTLVSVNAGLLFATYYGIAVSYSKYLKTDYGFTTAEVGAAYIVPGISLASGSLISGRLSDRLRQRAIRNSPNGKVIPEQRLPIQLFGIIVSMIGILCYGWMIKYHIHVASVMIFSFLAGFGMTWVFVVNTTYLTECAPGLPASMVAIASFFRNTGAAISSVIIEPLIDKMGVGWCFTGLALIDFFGIAMVIALVKFGPKWRIELEERKKAAIAKKEAEKIPEITVK